jgi:hypothetical protein
VVLQAFSQCTPFPVINIIFVLDEVQANAVTSFFFYHSLDKTSIHLIAKKLFLDVYCCILK